MDQIFTALAEHRQRYLDEFADIRIVGSNEPADRLGRAAYPARQAVCEADRLAAHERRRTPADEWRDPAAAAPRPVPVKEQAMFDALFTGTQPARPHRRRRRDR